MQWYLKTLRHYADFSGRARRKEYWFFVLFQAITFWIISFLERVFAVADPEIMFGWFSVLFLLATLLPALAVSARRLHDTDRLAWWLLFDLIPILGPLILLVFMLIKGTNGPNRYGPDPKQETL